jgi:DNA replication protein DnaC
MLERAHIPKRYEHCSLRNFVARFPGSDPTLDGALLKAKGFIQAYPLETDGKGLLLTGSIGVGKTHLAIGILKSLIEERGASCLFCDYRELLKEVQNSYNREVAATELGVLRPVFDAEVLVLDELGAAKPSDWVWDTVAHILNFRYNSQRTTIITTNYPNAEALRAISGRRAGKSSEQEDAERAVREETLGDRIGERMRSRLQEMCEVLEMRGGDFRQKMSRSDFASLVKESSATPDLLSAAEALLSAGRALQSAAEGDIPMISKAFQDGSKVIRGGATPRSGERPIVPPAPQAASIQAGARMSPLAATKRSEAAAELQVDAEKNDPNFGKVWVKGVGWQPMITQTGSDSGCGTVPDGPLKGRAKMGRHATPSPKRIVETDW